MALLVFYHDVLVKNPVGILFGPFLKCCLVLTISSLFYRSLAKGTLKPTRIKPLMQRIQNFIFSREFGRNFVLKKAKEGVMKQTSGLYPAPLKILEVIRTGLAEGPVAGYTAEAEVCWITNETYACVGSRSLVMNASRDPILLASKRN